MYVLEFCEIFTDMFEEAENFDSFATLELMFSSTSIQHNINMIFTSCIQYN